jgi:uncharacterized integral membrane protein
MVNVIIALIIIVFVAIFSVQNAAPVAISFLVWQFQASLAIVIFLCALCGITVGAILTLMVRIKKQRKTKMSGQTPSGSATLGKS